MKESRTVDATLSHYRIVAKLGAGGMGDVYRAEEIRLDHTGATQPTN